MMPPPSVQLALMNEEETIFIPRDLHDNSEDLLPVLFCDGTSRYGVPENLTTG